MRTSTRRTIAVALCGALALLGCSATMKGGGLGAGAGAGLGALIGKKAGNTTMGALVGAAVGGTAGALIGKHMDKQAAELQAGLGDAKVERVGEGIKVTLGSGILFSTNSAQLQAEGRTNITSLAQVLTKYPDTNVLVEGHTDADGTEAYNQKLSEQRAAAVADMLKSMGVAADRLTAVGHGESVPVADNATPAGKQQNRRVEVAIFANEAMKAAAAKGQL